MHFDTNKIPPDFDHCSPHAILISYPGSTFFNIFVCFAFVCSEVILLYVQGTDVTTIIYIVHITTVNSGTLL